MRDKVLFINADYYKERIPSDRSVDETKITSIIRTIQVTLVIDLLSDALYDYLYDKIDGSGLLTPEEEKLFDFLQLYMALAVADDYLTSNKEFGGSDPHDSAVAIHRAKLKVAKGRVKKIINESTTLSNIAGGSLEVEYSQDPINNAGGFYYV